MTATLDREPLPPLSVDSYPYGLGGFGSREGCFVHVTVIPSAAPPGYWDLALYDIDQGVVTSTRRPMSGSFVEEWIDLVCPRVVITRWESKVPPPASSTEPFGGARVYFIQCGTHGPIKIGTARDIGSRMDTLQTASPYLLRLLTSIPGDHAVERDMHLRFAADRLHGEWFMPSAALVAFIEQIPASVSATT